MRRRRGSLRAAGMERLRAAARPGPDAAQSAPFRVPFQPTPLIGRDREVALGLAMLAQPDVRLLTLTGAPGIGKTRTALELAGRMAPTFADGAAFVDLAPIRDAVGVSAAIAGTLRLREIPDLEPLDGLIERLQHKHLLLLLDNFEQVVAAAPQVAELLAACGRLKVLVTSRIPLRLSWEHQFPLPPLPVPDLDQLPPPAVLARTPSVALFVDRTRAVKPAFRLTADNARAVAEICVRLDGVPLAIELAAARGRAMDADQIAAHLDDRFRLLTTGSRSAPTRHQTLLAVIDWSHDLLVPAERAVLRRLGVFSGPFPADAAAYVSAGPPVDSGRLVDIIAALVDHSLVVTESETPDAFRLIETVRQYAMNRLDEAGESDFTRDRHADYYVRLMYAASHGLEWPKDPTLTQRMAGQHDNVRTAMERLIERGDAAGGLRLAAAAAGWIWGGLIPPTEVRQWLEDGLRRAPEVDTPLRARALHWAGELAWEVGDTKRAIAALEESATLHRQLGDDRALAAVLNTLGVVYYRSGDNSAAVGVLEESLAIGRTLEEASILAFALFVRGVVARLMGAYERAAALGSESVSVARAAGLQRIAALALDSLGLLACHQGNPAQGERYSGEALRLFRQLGDAYGTAASLNTLALAAMGAGNHALARARCNESLPLSRRLSARGSAARSMVVLGRTALAEGDPHRADTHFREALRLFRDIGEPLGVIQSVEAFAELAAALNNTAVGTRLAAAAGAARDRLGVVRPPSDRAAVDSVLHAAREHLGPAAAEAAWAGGRELTLEQGARETEMVALSLPPSPTPAVPRESVLSVRLFGGFEVRRGDAILPAGAWRRRRDRLLFCYLLLAREPVPREVLMDALWPDLSPESARASLNVAWSNFKRALEPAEGETPDYLRLERGRYGLRREAIVTDIQEFEMQMAAAGRAATTSEKLTSLEAAVASYRGDLLPAEANEPWTLVERERLRTAYISALEQLAEEKSEQGRMAEAAEHLRAILRLDPWREEVYRRLMRILAGMGRRAEALRLYQRCEEVLRRELDVAPSAETTAVYRAITAGRPV